MFFLSRFRQGEKDSSEYRVLSEVKDDFRRGRVRKNKGAAFTDRLKRFCLDRGIVF
ncbi:MAG: hypothetical protein ACPLRP_02970 [Candidatus Bipolaricaulaceae bacterium]